MGRIGTPEILVLIFILLIPFFIGYVIGKKSGYIKRVKEEKK
jgi:hypothetical protein